MTNIFKQTISFYPGYVFPPSIPTHSCVSTHFCDKSASAEASFFCLLCCDSVIFSQHPGQKNCTKSHRLITSHIYRYQHLGLGRTFLGDRLQPSSNKQTNKQNQRLKSLKPLQNQIDVKPGGDGNLNARIDLRLVTKPKRNHTPFVYKLFVYNGFC